jgi:hypothetical protein
MNLNITIDPRCITEVKDNAARWIEEAALWSAEQYNKVDLANGTVWNIEPFEFSAVAVQPQNRPIEIRISEVDNVQWTAEIQKREWFKSQLFHVGHEVGLKSAAVAVLRAAKHTLARDIGDDSYRANWDVEVQPYEEKLLYFQQFYPDLIKSWTDRSGWLDDFRKNIKPTHWTFPAINPRLCRSGRWGEGAVFPPGSGRK